MPDTEQRKYFPLSFITERIGKLLEPAITRQFWVRAEISSGRERGGSFFCDLVETNQQGSIVARLSCTIWQSELKRIKNSFTQQGLTFAPADGTAVGLLCSLQYSPQYGISLRVIDADPALALGDLELKKRAIIERLQQEGLHLPNRELQVPLLPLALGLITSAGSAAYNDLLKTLKDSRYGFRIHLADAMMQGEQTERSVLKALDALMARKPELIIIARGGGSRTDLAWLDNEAIARKIAACPVPVWTGIGHEIDTSVLDLVASQAFKTPTAVGEELVARFVQMRRRLDEGENSLRSVWNLRYAADRQYIDRAQTGIRQGTRKLLETVSTALKNSAWRLNLSVKNRIGAEQYILATRRELLRRTPLARVGEGRAQQALFRQTLLSRTDSMLRINRGWLAEVRQRFSRERYLRFISWQQEDLHRIQMSIRQRTANRVLILRERIAAQKRRLRPERILVQLTAAHKSLLDKQATLRAADPQNALKRGFALVYTTDGTLLRSIDQVQEHTTITTRLGDGRVTSTVTGKEKQP